MTQSGRGSSGPSRKRLPARQRRQLLLLLLAVVLIVVAAVIGILVAMDRRQGETPEPISTTLSEQEGQLSTPSSTEGISEPESTSSESTSSEPTSSKPSGGQVGNYPTQDWNLILINKQNLLPEDYTVDLVTVSGGQRVDARIVEPLTDMLNAARQAGYSGVYVMSGYRSPEDSQTLIDREVLARVNQGMDEQAAYEEVIQAIAPPYTSEHNAGIAVDIYAPSYSVYGFSPALENQADYSWFKEHCAEYGFILRYPKDKVDVTQYQFEPWHFRYVGQEAAQAIMSQGICLEEYLGQA